MNDIITQSIEFDDEIIALASITDELFLIST